MLFIYLFIKLDGLKALNTNGFQYNQLLEVASHAGRKDKIYKYKIYIISIKYKITAYNANIAKSVNGEPI